MSILKKIKKAWVAYWDLDKKLSEKLNIQKKNPLYITRPIFWIAYFVVSVICLHAFYNYGFSDNYYLTCNDQKGCLNPVYICQETDLKFVNGIFVFPNDCHLKEYVSHWDVSICEQLPCDKKFLSYGEAYGTPDPNYLTYIYSTFILAWVLNHIFYVFKMKRLDKKPEAKK